MLVLVFVDCGTGLGASWGETSPRAVRLLLTSFLVDSGWQWQQCGTEAQRRVEERVDEAVEKEIGPTALTAAGRASPSASAAEALTPCRRSLASHQAMCSNQPLRIYSRCLEVAGQARPETREGGEKNREGTRTHGHPRLCSRERKEKVYPIPSYSPPSQAQTRHMIRKAHIFAPALNQRDKLL